VKFFGRIPEFDFIFKSENWDVPIIKIIPRLQTVPYQDLEGLPIRVSTIMILLTRKVAVTEVSVVIHDLNLF